MRKTKGYYANLPRRDWGGALTGASTGFKMGSSIGASFGPLVGGIAGGVGALIGGLTGNASENRKAREQAKQDAAIAKAKEDERLRTLAMQKSQLKSNDSNYLANFKLNDENSLFMKKGGWIQKVNKSIKKRGTEGKCTPMSKPGCTGRALALAKTFHAMARKRKKHEFGGEVLADGGVITTKNSPTKSLKDTVSNIINPMVNTPINSANPDKRRTILVSKGDEIYDKGLRLNSGWIGSLRQGKDMNAVDNTVIGQFQGKDLTMKEFNSFPSRIKNYYNSDFEYERSKARLGESNNFDAMNHQVSRTDPNMYIPSSNFTPRNKVARIQAKGGKVDYTGMGTKFMNTPHTQNNGNMISSSTASFPITNGQRTKEFTNSPEFKKMIMGNTQVVGGITGMLNKMDAIESIVTSPRYANLGKDAQTYIRETLPNLSKEKFQESANLAGLTPLGKYWTDSPSAISKLHGKGGRIGKISARGISLGEGDKLLTNTSGGTSGTHESGQNIPLNKNGKTVAYAEPGEVLVNDSDVSKTPFILSKRFGVNGTTGDSFAKDYMDLENMKTKSNDSTIEDKQAKLVTMNNRIAGKGKYAYSGINTAGMNRNISNLGLSNKNYGIQNYSGYVPSKTATTSGNANNFLSKINFDSIASSVGTIGNLLTTNKAIKRQKGLIQGSLNDALAYNPVYNKNYLLNDQVDVNSQVGAINQGFSSATAGLEGIDPAIASSLKSSVSMDRTNQLSSIYGQRNNARIGIRNQNTGNIMNNNNANNAITNETAMMKLNAKISANEQLGAAESAGVASTQGALGEFNTMLRDQQVMNSLKNRWKDSIGNSPYTAQDPTKDMFGNSKAFGGRIGKKKKVTMHKIAA